MNEMGPTERLLLSMAKNAISEYKKNEAVMKRKLDAFSRMNSASWNSAEYASAKKDAISALNSQLIAYQDYRNFLSRLKPLWKKIKIRLEESRLNSGAQHYEARDLTLTEFVMNELDRLLHPGWFRSGILEVIERQIIYLSDDDNHRFEVYFKKEMRLLYNLSKKIGFDDRLALPTDIMIRLRKESNSFARRSMLGVALLIAAIAINYCEINKAFNSKVNPSSHPSSHIQMCMEETGRWSEHLGWEMIMDDYPHTPLDHEGIVDDRSPPTMKKSMYQIKS
ncbi:MAG: hypothetical protein V1866_01530 [archaeon]